MQRQCSLLCAGTCLIDAGQRGGQFWHRDICKPIVCVSNSGVLCWCLGARPLNQGMAAQLLVMAHLQTFVVACAELCAVPLMWSVVNCLCHRLL